jgi:hypothetical protein
VNLEKPSAGDLFLIAALCFLCGLFGSAVTIKATRYSWESAAIQHNAAHYDAKTGAFTWNDEKKAENQSEEASGK